MPSAELGDDPGSPCEGVFGVGVFLAGGAALHSLIEQGDERDLVGCEGEAGGPPVGAGAGLYELHDDGGGFGGDGDQLAEAVGGGELAVFDAQSLELEGAEELLDDPALLVPSDDLPGLVEGPDG